MSLFTFSGWEHCAIAADVRNAIMDGFIEDIDFLGLLVNLRPRHFISYEVGL
jgi:hypothetical protein